MSPKVPLVPLVTLMVLMGWPSHVSAQRSSGARVAQDRAPMHLSIEAAPGPRLPIDEVFTRRATPPSRVRKAFAGALAGALFGGIVGGLHGGSQEGCNQCDVWGATAGAFLGSVVGITLALILH